MVSEQELMLHVFPDVESWRLIVVGEEPIDDTQNMTYKFNGSNIGLLESASFFSGLYSDKNHKLSPLMAEFDLSWRLSAQKNGQHDYLIDSGRFKGNAWQGAFLPKEIQLPTANDGYVNWKFYLTDLDSIFKENGDGWYLITMNSHLKYSFYSWSGNWTSKELDYTFFTINCTYVDSKHTWMEIYYPMPLFVRVVQITHPILMWFKLNTNTVAGTGVVLSIISCGGYGGYYHHSKRQKKTMTA